MVDVRWAVRGEAPKVYALFRKLVEAEAAEPPNPTVFARTWSRSFKEGSHFHFVVGIVEGAIVGCMSLHDLFSTWKGAPVVSLEDFFVEHNHRGKGLGTAMLAFADEHAASRGAARIELHVRRDNERAQKLYQRGAFEDQPYLWYQKQLAPSAAAKAKVAAAAAKPKPKRRGRPRRR